jgi:hypothetical protein
MHMVSRRSAIVAAFGSMASAASVSAWLLRGWGQDATPAHGRRIRTRFGSVQLVASRWEAGTGQPGTGQPGTGRSGEVATAWADRIVVLVEVRNESGSPIRVTPGQFQLRVGSDGPTVALLLAEPHGGVVAPRRVLQLRLTFLAPAGHPALALEYQETGAPASHVAALSPAGAGSVHA